MLLKILHSIGLTNLSEKEVSKYYRNRYITKLFNGNGNFSQYLHNAAIDIFQYNKNIDSFIEDSKYLLNSIYDEEIKNHGLTEEENKRVLNNKNSVFRLVTQLDQNKGKAFYKQIDQKELLKEMHRTKTPFYFFETKKGNLISITSDVIIRFETNYGSITTA